MATGSVFGVKSAMLHFTDVEVSKDVLGTSFSQTSRTPGTCLGLLGIPADKILSITPYNNNLSPASNMVIGIYDQNLYLATTQACTLSSSVRFKIVYHD